MLPRKKYKKAKSNFPEAAPVMKSEDVRGPVNELEKAKPKPKEEKKKNKLFL